MSLPRKPRNVKGNPPRDTRGRFIRKLREERKELKAELPVKTIRARDERGRFVSKRLPKGDVTRDKKGKFRKAENKELEKEVKKLRREIEELKEERRVQLLAGIRRVKLVGFASYDVLYTMLRFNDSRYLEYMRYCRKLGMTPKQARDSWFSPRIQVAA